MKKTILFVGPKDVGIIQMISDRLANNADYEIDYINLLLTKEEKFRYKSFSQRAYNFFLKNFRKKNIKHTYYHELIRERIEESKKQYDVVVVIRPDMMDDKNLQLLRKLTPHYVAYYWDTVSFFPRKLAIRHFFDRIFSFDLNDCKKYGFELLTNFYFDVDPQVEIKYEVYGLATYDKRIPQFEKVASLLTKKSISFCIKAFSRKPFKSDYIQRISEVLEYKKMLTEASYSNIILEIQKKGQGGLSFRPFEALGMRKKLITNNAMIRFYDFYSENNILIIDPENISLPDAFFTQAYQEVPEEIRNKYRFDNWFNTLISPLKANFVMHE